MRARLRDTGNWLRLYWNRLRFCAADEAAFAEVCKFSSTTMEKLELTDDIYKYYVAPLTTAMANETGFRSGNGIFIVVDSRGGEGIAQGKHQPMRDVGMS